MNSPSSILTIVSILFTLFLSACDKGDSDESLTLLLNKGHDDGAAWGLKTCSSCHPMSALHRDIDSIRHVVAEKGYDSCTGCHGSNGSDEKRQCVICHNVTERPSSPDQSGVSKHDFGSKGAVLDEDEACVICHQASDMNGQFSAKVDLSALDNATGGSVNNISVSRFCVACHNRDKQQVGFEISSERYDDPLVAMQDNYRFIDKHGELEGDGLGLFNGLRGRYHYRSSVECTDCHAMHGTENRHLIIDRAGKGGSLLPEHMSQIPITTVDGNTSQLCVVCHQMNNLFDSGGMDTGNGLAGVHETSTDCVVCHSHGEAIQVGL